MTYETTTSVYGMTVGGCQNLSIQLASMVKHLPSEVPRWMASNLLDMIKIARKIEFANRLQISSAGKNLSIAEIEKLYEYRNAGHRFSISTKADKWNRKFHIMFANQTISLDTDNINSADHFCDLVNNFDPIINLPQ